MPYSLVINNSTDNSNDNSYDLYSQLVALLALELNDNNPTTTEIINDYLINNPNAFPPLNNYINTSVNTTPTTPSTTTPTTPSATTPTTPTTSPPATSLSATTIDTTNLTPINNIYDYGSSSSDDSYFDDMPELISNQNDDDLYDSDCTVCAYPSVAPYP